MKSRFRSHVHSSTNCCNAVLVRPRVAALTIILGRSYVQAQTLTTATLTHPLNASTNVDLSLPIQWSSVPNVQAYYLYVGSTRGAKDLVDSDEILQTSYLASGLPASQTLYARLWTKVDNVWRFVDSTFSAAPILRARITFPADGAVDADLSQRIQWTTVTNVQAYYLYVGTTIGAKALDEGGGSMALSGLDLHGLADGAEVSLPHRWCCRRRPRCRSAGSLQRTR